MRAQADYPLVTALIDIFADWWKDRRDRRHDLDSLDRSDLEAIAKDVGVSVADLRELDRSDTELLLPDMLAALDIDRKALANAQPILFRDLQRVCAMCGSKKRCAQALADGEAAATYERFCPNAMSLKALH
jgi:hypothetical protein